MTDYIKIHKQELQNSATAITPICFVIDTSGSMKSQDSFGKSRMDRLNEGFHQFLEQVRGDNVLADSVEIAAVVFNSEAKVEFNFTTIDNLNNINFKASGMHGNTPLGVKKALEIIDKEKKLLIENRKNVRKPWIVIMSDGRASDENGTDGDIIRKVSEMQDRLKIMEDAPRGQSIHVIPVFINDKLESESQSKHKSAYEKGLEQMKGFTKGNRCKEILSNEPTSFREFFKTLSQSISTGNTNFVFGKSANGERYGEAPKSTDKPEKDLYVSTKDLVNSMKGILNVSTNDLVNSMKGIQSANEKSAVPQPQRPANGTTPGGDAVRGGERYEPRVSSVGGYAPKIASVKPEPKNEERQAPVAPQVKPKPQGPAYGTTPGGDYAPKKDLVKPEPKNEERQAPVAPQVKPQTQNGVYDFSAAAALLAEIDDWENI